MSVAGRITGQNLYVTFGGTVLTGDQTSLSISDENAVAEATAGADTYNHFISLARRNSTVDYEAMYDGSTTTVWAAIQPGASGTLIVGPKGTASGYPKWTWANAIITTREVEFPFDDAVTVTASFQNDALVTEATW